MRYYSGKGRRGGAGNFLFGGELRRFVGKMVPWCLCWAMAVMLIAVVDVSGALRDVEGNVYEGEIFEVFYGEVVILGADEDTDSIRVSMEQLDEASQAVVAEWKAANEHMVNVYSRFDERPSPLRTNNPRNFLRRQHQEETGLVAVRLVISSDGDVLSVAIARSNNLRLNEAAVNAVREWKFRPAIVDGEPVKSRIVLPLRFG